ncbi:MAG: hypothetical protein ABI222_12430 [Opitutaceae bacterium]
MTCSFTLKISAEALEGSSYSIIRRDAELVFTGDRPRTLLAGVLYYCHHLRTGSLPPLPIRRKALPGSRLIIEDFPFHCYAPTGFAFDADRYAANLVELGFSAMECNRLQLATRTPEFYDGYQLVNPSPAAFVWTRWHEGVWDREEIARNALELDRCIALALEFDLEPTLTSFVPRPYPESFFARHPHLRGPGFSHRYLKEGNHGTAYSLDTDNPETLDFYRTVYASIFSRHPQIRHLCFWHGDLGTQFWKDGEGPRGRKFAERVGEFHRMIADLLKEYGMTAQVWINPWALPKDCLTAMDDALPADVGYTVKDNPGAEIMTGSDCIPLADATIVTSQIGTVPVFVKQLAARRQRRVCLGQYVDFSEDLDPILGVPHPIMTFRKIQSLRRFNASDSSANWGILSPDRVPVNPNQDVLREMCWGEGAATFAELLPRLFPAQLGESERGQILQAWKRVDEALRLWPQHWGLRLQDSGVRLRWLVRPILCPGAPVDSEGRDYYLAHQIYHVDAPDISTAFLDLSKPVAAELRDDYAVMIERLGRAEGEFSSALASAASSMQAWISSQLASTRLLRLFWTTYQHQLDFAACDREAASSAALIRRIVEAEMENVRETIDHLTTHPSTLLLLERKECGQCLDRNIVITLRRKYDLMAASLRFGST